MSRARVILLAGLALGVGLVFRPVAAQQQAPLVYDFHKTRADIEAHLAAAAAGTGYVPGEVIVKFRTGTTVAGQARALDVLRARPSTDRLRWIADRTAHLRVEGDTDSPAIAAALAAQPEVEYAQPNWIRRPRAIPNDPGFASAQWNLSELKMPAAWDINTGTGVIVAVIDTGMTSAGGSHTFRLWNGSQLIDYDTPYAASPDFDAARIVDGRDFAFWTGPVVDFVGHGTHVAATIAQSTNNAIGFAGMAYNARVMPLKACIGYWEFQFIMSAAGIPGFAPQDVGGCADVDGAAAIRYAVDNGAKVINISIGGFEPAPLYFDALNYAVSRGVFVAISAGNGFQEGNFPEYPAAYAPQLQGVMAVGAVGRSLTRAAYSTTGSYIEIAAPGGNGQDGGNAGLIWQVGLDEALFDTERVILPRFNAYVPQGFQGTSMASPHVAGLAALLMSQGITAPAAVEAIITRTARDLGAPGRDDDFGHGLIEPRAALRGFGLVR